MAVDHERRIDRIERIIEIYDERLEAGSRIMATHDLRIGNLEQYDKEQNGSLLRLETKFDNFCTRIQKSFEARWDKIIWLLVTLLVSVVTLLVRGVF